MSPWAVTITGAWCPRCGSAELGVLEYRVALVQDRASARRRLFGFGIDALALLEAPDAQELVERSAPQVRELVTASCSACGAVASLSQAVAALSQELAEGAGRVDAGEPPASQGAPA